jgi:sterol 3beta-glucosyltransferase
VNRLRRRYGLRAVRNVAVEAFVSPKLNLVAVSPRVAPPPPGTPARFRWTGYWFLDRPDWRPPPELVAFLGRGPKPVAISFSSSSGFFPETPLTRQGTDAMKAYLSPLVVEAVERAGVLALVYPGWFDPATPLPETIRCVGDVPHAWLFPHVAAVVHHGGAGTTAAALRAGVPAVVMPMGVDQPFWGQTVAALGVGPAPVPHQVATAERLAGAIRQAVADGGMGARAAALGARLREEDGVGTAVRLVEQFTGAEPDATGEGRRVKASRGQPARSGVRPRGRYGT